MTPGARTGWGIIAAITAVSAVDYVLHVRYGWSGTISGVLARLGQRWPLFVGLVAFAMGVLFGHWFFGA